MPSFNGTSVNGVEGDFVTVVDVARRDDEFVTVLKVNEHGLLVGPDPKRSHPDQDQGPTPVKRSGKRGESVQVYRLPGERLGMALKFEGGVSASEPIHRVFIQSINDGSPASRAGSLVPGDQITEIQGIPVSSMTRIDCVTALRDAPVCISLTVIKGPNNRTPIINNRSCSKGPPPPVPPRLSTTTLSQKQQQQHIHTTNHNHKGGNRTQPHQHQHDGHSSQIMKGHSATSSSTSSNRKKIPPPLPPRRPKDPPPAAPNPNSHKVSAKQPTANNKSPHQVHHPVPPSGQTKPTPSSSASSSSSSTSGNKRENGFPPKRDPINSRQREGRSSSSLPPPPPPLLSPCQFQAPIPADVYTDLFSKNQSQMINMDGESDADTASTISTVVEKHPGMRSFHPHTSPSSQPMPQLSIDIDDVLSPFEQLERELDHKPAQPQSQSHPAVNGSGGPFTQLVPTNEGATSNSVQRNELVPPKKTTIRTKPEIKSATIKQRPGILKKKTPSPNKSAPSNLPSSVSRPKIGDPFNPIINNHPHIPGSNTNLKRSTSRSSVTSIGDPNSHIPIISPSVSSSLNRKCQSTMNLTSSGLMSGSQLALNEKSLIPRPLSKNSFTKKSRSSTSSSVSSLIQPPVSSSSSSSSSSFICSSSQQVAPLEVDSSDSIMDPSSSQSTSSEQDMEEENQYMDLIDLPSMEPENLEMITDVKMFSHFMGLHQSGASNGMHTLDHPGDKTTSYAPPTEEPESREEGAPNQSMGEKSSEEISSKGLTQVPSFSNGSWSECAVDGGFKLLSRNPEQDSQSHPPLHEIIPSPPSSLQEQDSSSSSISPFSSSSPSPILVTGQGLGAVASAAITSHSTAYSSTLLLPIAGDGQQGHGQQYDQPSPQYPLSLNPGGSIPGDGGRECNLRSDAVHDIEDESPPCNLTMGSGERSLEKDDDFSLVDSVQLIPGSTTPSPSSSVDESALNVNEVPTVKHSHHQLLDEETVERKVDICSSTPTCGRSEPEPLDERSSLPFDMVKSRFEQLKCGKIHFPRFFSRPVGSPSHTSPSLPTSVTRKDPTPSISIVAQFPSHHQAETKDSPTDRVHLSSQGFIPKIQQPEPPMVTSVPPSDDTANEPASGPLSQATSPVGPTISVRERIALFQQKMNQLTLEEEKKSMPPSFKQSRSLWDISDGNKKPINSTNGFTSTYTSQITTSYNKNGFNYDHPHLHDVNTTSSSTKNLMVTSPTPVYSCESPVSSLTSSASLSSLLDTRKSPVSKFKGLVIPDSVGSTDSSSASSSPSSANLPTILPSTTPPPMAVVTTNNTLRSDSTSSSSSTGSLNRPIFQVNPPFVSSCPFNAVPKYSPAFKRRALETTKVESPLYTPALRSTKSLASLTSPSPSPPEGTKGLLNILIDESMKGPIEATSSSMDSPPSSLEGCKIQGDRNKPQESPIPPSDDPSFAPLAPSSSTPSVPMTLLLRTKLTPSQESAAPKESSPMTPPSVGSSVGATGTQSKGSPTSSSTTSPPIHARYSSVDSTTSDSGFSTPGDKNDFSPNSFVHSLSTSFSNLRDSHYGGSVSSIASTTSLISPQELQQLMDDANGSLDGDCTGHNIQVVVLNREYNSAGSVGISLAGGVDYETKDITVHRIITGSLADRDGRIKKGDRILSINGKIVKGLTHREALDIMKSPRPEVVLVLSRSNQATSSSLDSPTIESSADFAKRLSLLPELAMGSLSSPTVDDPSRVYKTLPVILNKDGAGLGFILEGGKDSPLGDKPLAIKRIFKGGLADKEGTLIAGDEIISINGEPVQFMTRTECWNYLKKLPDCPVNLIIRRVDYGY